MSALPFCHDGKHAEVLAEILRDKESLRNMSAALREKATKVALLEATRYGNFAVAEYFRLLPLLAVVCGCGSLNDKGIYEIGENWEDGLIGRQYVDLSATRAKRVRCWKGKAAQDAACQGLHDWEGKGGFTALAQLRVKTVKAAKAFTVDALIKLLEKKELDETTQKVLAFAKTLQN